MISVYCGVIATHGRGRLTLVVRWDSLQRYHGKEHGTQDSKMSEFQQFHFQPLDKSLDLSGFICRSEMSLLLRER